MHMLQKIGYKEKENRLQRKQKQTYKTMDYKLCKQLKDVGLLILTTKGTIAPINR